MYTITEIKGIIIRPPYPTQEEIDKVKKEYKDKYPEKKFSIGGTYGKIIIFENE